jgi:sterol desaturase/sphingolipid hydroxylase (fatty acid hydroxylase superfamily)
MDDLAFGTRNARGDWTPKGAKKIAPIYRLPWKREDILTFIKGYFLPWNASWMALAALYWLFLTPDIETLKTLSLGWVFLILLRNALAILILYGGIELRLYIRRKQGRQFKYNHRFPGDQRSSAFLFESQAIDGIIRTFGTGVPIWTAYETLILWSYANGYGLWSTLGQNPLWFAALWLLAPIWHEFHFYCIHRLIHIPALYKYVHAIHHRSVNPSPWSSLSMHPVEHLLYFSGSLLHLLLPSHPMIAIYQLNIAGMGAIPGHIGFDKIVTDNDRTLETHAYAHYLHHKYFEVNYGDGSVPLDKLFGTWHDGTEAGDALLAARRKKQRQPAS